MAVGSTRKSELRTRKHQFPRDGDTGPARAAKASGAGEILAVQRKAGNAAAGYLLKNDPNLAPAEGVQRERTVTFGEDEGSHISQLTADEADEEVKKIHEDIGKEIGFFHDHWKSGLSNFATAMKFASSQEAETNHVSNLGKTVAKGLFDAALDVVGSVPGVGTAIKHAVKIPMEMGMAVYAEEQRALGAKGERQIAQYIEDLESAVTKSNTESQRVHTDNWSEVLSEYREAARSSPSAEETTGDAAWVFEDAARWIRAYRQVLTGLRNAIPEPARFRQLITERFAQTGAKVGLATQGTWRDAGTLTLAMEVKASESGEIEASSISSDSKWVLHTNAPEPDNVAQNLQSSLGGSSPVFSSLPKEIVFDVTVDIPWAIDRPAPCTLHMEGPLHDARGHMEHDRSTDEEEDRRNRKIARNIGRSPAVADKMLGPTEIRGEPD